MMVIRPIERADITALMQLASKTGGGLTSLPANEATLMARIERSLQTWRGELPKSEQGYVFVLEDSTSGTVAGGGACGGSARSGDDGGEVSESSGVVWVIEGTREGGFVSRGDKEASVRRRLCQNKKAFTAMETQKP